MNRSQKIRFNKARKFALNGDFETAIPIFEKISDELNEAANASLAGIFGFLFDWEKCLRNAGQFVANPNAAYAGNVFNEMILLLGRAGNETQKWQDVESICENAVERIKAEEYQPWNKERYVKVLTNLKNYAQREGKGEQELLKIFGVKSEIDKLSDDQRRANFDEAMANINNVRPDLSGKREETIRHKIALAFLFQLEDEATKLFMANENLQIYDFEFLIPIFRHLIKLGETEKAWRLIEDKISFWVPCDLTQIAPVALLTDEILKTIINAERSLQILRTPRGQ
jgi:hypothetical protein